MFELDGKCFLVAGGTRGIGRAISLRFAEAGAMVIANYVRDDNAAATLLETAKEKALSIHVLRADLTGKKGLRTIKEHIQDNDIELTGLVYCAATGIHRNFEELTSRHFDWVYALNVRAFLELVNLLLPHFTDNSSIVAMSSQGATQAVPYYSLVGSSKAALESLVRHLAIELAPKGIRVNTLSPGSVLTDAWDAMPDKDQRLGETIRKTPVGRLTTPEDVAWAALFLCCDASKAIVGHTLVVDGGARIVA